MTLSTAVAAAVVPAEPAPLAGVVPDGVVAPRRRCEACREDVSLPPFTMAFQPIVDAETGETFAYEALVRPPGGGSAAAVLARIHEGNRYAFDQACRVRAIELAARLGLQSLLSINFLPNAVYQPAACLRKTFEAAARSGFPPHHLMFEVTETEPTRDVGHLRSIFTEYKRHGMLTAIDDFGAGHSGLNMLADFQPDVVKLDMGLVRNLHADRVRRAITRSIVSLCQELGISVIAEGIECRDEALALRDLGVRLFQGFYFARPGLEQLPRVPAETLARLRLEHETALVAGAARGMPRARRNAG
ncbi:MAG: EAL domain-containing protein [Steroidobacteraceae bacterium]|nr:EAL domain-containing protein [Steroidobacteraceae bacterium]